MISIENKKDCCGCTACASICPHKAISMKPDTLGFLYPKVDLSLCTNCGLCEKVCSFNEHYDTSLNLPVPDVYAVRHKDMHEIETSRSGAMFIALSDWVLNQGGIIYGAGYMDHFRVVHKRATTKEERNEFKGSKYVQSDMNTIFLQVKQDLKNGLNVLFSGTPCQTAGLSSFIGNKLREKLILVDIVCHGVPAPYIWKDYLTFLEGKYQKGITFVNFRDKSRLGWNAHVESFTFVDKTKKEFNIYASLFNQCIMFRPSCGKCHYTNFSRPSDITIADFWGWQKTNATFNSDDKGVSLVLVNTEKGKMLFNSVKEEINFIASSIDKCLQPNLQQPSVIHSKRDLFEEEYKKYGFMYIAKKYTHVGLKNRIIILIRKIKNRIIQLIKKII